MAVTICIILRDVCFSGVSSAYCAQLFSLSGVWHSVRSEEHTSELQSQSNLVCRLLLEKKNAWKFWLGMTDPTAGLDHHIPGCLDERLPRPICVAWRGICADVHAYSVYPYCLVLPVTDS